MSTTAPAPRAEERWLAGASPVERLSATTALFVLVSVAIHVAMVATTLVGTRPALPPQQEIAVEIVREVPKATSAAKTEASKTEASKAGSPRAEPAKPEPAKPEPAKPEPAKPEAAKLEPPKAETVKAEPPPARVEQASAPPQPAAPPVDTAAEARKADAIKAMESEIASLKAEQAALQAERETAEREAAARAAETADARPVALRETGLGPLPESFQAVALPSTADGAGEAVGYRDIVFSALAKAKEIGGAMGLPGSAGVHFEIDAAGGLIKVELVHPSGVATLDAQALTIVRKAAPFPPPPQGAQRSFDANVNFVTASGR